MDIQYFNLISLLCKCMPVLIVITTFTSPYSEHTYHRLSVGEGRVVDVDFWLLRTALRGGDLGDWGTVPQKKFEVGDGPCIRPPNILRSSVVGCALKYEQSKRKWHKVIFMSYTTFNIVKLRKIWH